MCYQISLKSSVYDRENKDKRMIHNSRAFKIFNCAINYSSFMENNDDDYDDNLVTKLYMSICTYGCTGLSVHEDSYTWTFSELFREHKSRTSVNRTLLQ